MERSRRKPEWQLKIARERIDILFAEAAKTKSPELQKRYVELARKIGMRYNVKLDGRYKRRFCRYCHAYFSHDTRHRMKNGVLIITCPGCKKVSRFPCKR